MTLPPIDEEDQRFLHYNPNTSDLVAWVQAYAAAAVAAEREACAKMIESVELVGLVGDQLADLIRARKD